MEKEGGALETSDVADWEATAMIASLGDGKVHVKYIFIKNQKPCIVGSVRT